MEKGSKVWMFSPDLWPTENATRRPFRRIFLFLSGIIGLFQSLGDERKAPRLNLEHRKWGW